jgi:hypothetical protein
MSRRTSASHLKRETPELELSFRQFHYRNDAGLAGARGGG